MDVWAQLLAGFQVALTGTNLLWCLVGCALGTAVGVLPGVGPAVTVALLLPITTKVDASGALIMFAGIYYGAMYGGSTTSILLNTPGESATIVTAMEGNEMAKRGRAGPALATAAIGSFIAGTIATIGLTFLAPLVVELGLKFGPPEYFALMVLAFTTVSAVLGESTLRGLVSVTVNEPLLLFHSWPSMGPRNNRVAPSGTLNCCTTLPLVLPSPMKNGCLSRMSS